jgi:hypothetical protein
MQPPGLGSFTGQWLERQFSVSGIQGQNWMRVALAAILTAVGFSFWRKG